jgi:hypothetical protein
MAGFSGLVLVHPILLRCCLLLLHRCRLLRLLPKLLLLLHRLQGTGMATPGVHHNMHMIRPPGHASELKDCPGRHRTCVTEQRE